MALKEWGAAAAALPGRAVGWFARTTVQAWLKLLIIILILVVVIGLGFVLIKFGSWRYETAQLKHAETQTKKQLRQQQESRVIIQRSERNLTDERLERARIKSEALATDEEFRAWYPRGLPCRARQLSAPPGELRVEECHHTGPTGHDTDPGAAPVRAR